MKQNNRSLISLTFLYSIGNLSSKVLSFILVFFATFYLTKEEIGYYDLILITMGLATPFLTLQLSDATLRWLLEDNSIESRRKIVSNVGSMLFASIAVIAIIFIVVSSFCDIEYGWVVLSLISLQGLFQFFQQCARGMGDNKLYVRSSVLYNFLYVAFAIASLSLFNQNVAGLIYSNLLAGVCSIIVIVFSRNKLYQYFDPKELDFDFIKKLLKYSFPLIPNSISWWAISSANRYIIMLYAGIAANGIFSISYKFPTILLMFSGIFQLAWQEKSITTFKEKDIEIYYSNVLGKYLTLLFSISTVIVAANKFVLRLIVNKEFYESWKFTPILLLAVVISCVSGFYGTIYLSTKKTKDLFVSSLLGGIITVVVSLCTVRFFYLYGAAFSILIGYISVLVYRLKTVSGTVKIEFPTKTFYSLLSVFVFVSAVSFVDNIIVQSLNLCCATILIVIINYSRITKILKDIRLRFSSIQTKLN